MPKHLALSLLLIASTAHATGSVYELRPSVDIPLTIIPAVIGSAWLLAPMLAGPHCAPVCDPATLNSLDRQVAGRYSAAWQTTSDVAVLGLAVGAAGTAWVDGGLSGGLGDLVVILESVLWADALAVVANLAARRPRPLVYGELAPLTERTEGKAALSFFSGHTASAFALASAATATAYRRHGGDAFTWVVGGVGHAVAALVASGRVMGGKHFPTDVLAGAAVGVAMGVLVPALHDAPVQVTPAIGPEGAGVSVAWVW